MLRLKSTRFCHSNIASEQRTYGIRIVSSVYYHLPLHEAYMQMIVLMLLTESSVYVLCTATSVSSSQGFKTHFLLPVASCILIITKKDKYLHALAK